MTSCTPFGLHAGDTGLSGSQHRSIVADLHTVDAVLDSKVEVGKVMATIVQMEHEQG